MAEASKKSDAAPSTKAAEASSQPEVRHQTVGEKLVMGFGLFAVIMGSMLLLAPDDEGPPRPPMNDNNVWLLRDDMFDLFMETNPKGAVIDFYQNNCKFCIQLAPNFEKAAKALFKAGENGDPPAVTFAYMEASQGGETMKKLGIQRFPTVLWFYKGKKMMELPRASEKSAREVYDWAKAVASPPVQELDTNAEFEEGLDELRENLHEKARMIVAWNKTGMREAIADVAQHHRRNVVFVFVKKAVKGGGSALRSYAKTAANDEVFSGFKSKFKVTTEEVLPWVAEVLHKADPTADKESAEGAEEAPTKEEL